MKAAVLHAFGQDLAIQDMPDPTIGTGEALVDVAAAGVLPYTNEVISGHRKYLLTLPCILGVGAIGRVRATGPDATRLRPGDWVFCDPTVRSRDNGLDPDITLQGWSARGEGGIRLQQHHRHGSFAERMAVPTENAISIGAIDPAQAAHWTALNLLLVPYGGLLAANLQAGETLLVSGATGNFGSAGVMVALAMGAGCVICPGRNRAMLDELVRRFGPRVRPVTLTGDAEADQARMRQAAPGPIDCVLDLLPPSVPATVVRTALMTLRRGGRAVLMGGVGMLGGAELALPYPWIMRNNISIIGQWMCPPVAVTRLAALVHAGLLPLEQFQVRSFRLDQANEAVAHAAAHDGAFRSTAIIP